MTFFVFVDSILLALLIVFVLMGVVSSTISMLGVLVGLASLLPSLVASRLDIVLLLEIATLCLYCLSSRAIQKALESCLGPQSRG